MYRYWREIVSIAAGIIILVFNYFIVADIIPIMVPVFNVLGGLIASVPPTLIFYTRYKMNKEIEQQFIIFINDLTDSIDSGMTLPMALSHCSKRDYLALTKHVNDIAYQVDWGIPFKKALGAFGKKTTSIPVKRAITTLIKTYEAGGKISDTLKSVNKSLTTIEKLRKERSSSVYSQTITSYIIYFVFIFILVIMKVFLIPNLTQQEVSNIMLTTETLGIAPTEIYAETFIYFIIIQGFFAGLVTGKMAEGSIVSGFKHSIFLIIIGYAIFSIASQFQIQFF